MKKGENYLNIIDQLKDVVPSGLDNRLNYVDQTADKLSFQILSKSRSVFYLMNFNDLQPAKGQNDNRYEYLRSCSCSPHEAISYYPPLEIQSLASFSRMLISKPTNLAHAVSKFYNQNQNTSQLRDLITISLPALFSFFSTCETSGLAFNFYSALSSILSTETFSTFVYPFLNAPSIHHFSNHIFQELFTRIYVKKVSPHQFIQTLLDLTVESFSYLSPHHMALLRILKIQTSEQNVWYIIIKCILIPQLKIYSVLSPFCHCSLLLHKISTYIEILNELCQICLSPNSKKNNQKIRSNIKIPNLNLEQHNSLYEIPETYIAFGETFTSTLILTLNDVRILVSLEMETTHYMEKLKQFCERQSDPFQPFS